MIYRLLLLLAFSLLNNLAYASLTEDATRTFQQITGSLSESQLPDGEWLGVIEADPAVDLMPLVLSKKMGLKHEPLEEEIFERLRHRQDPITGAWSEYPGEGPNADVTGTILYTLKSLGYSEKHPLLVRAWDWLNVHKSENKKFRLSVGNRLIGVMGDYLPRNQFIKIPVHFLALPEKFPVNIHSMGFLRMGMIPYTVWGHYRDAREKNKSVAPMDPERIASKGLRLARPKFTLKKKAAEFWAQEGISWLLNHQQKDGTWGGALQMTYFSMLALYEAQLAGVGDFSRELNLAWKGIVGWRARIPEGPMIQQSTVGPVMDTGRILSAISAAPKKLGLQSLSQERRNQAIKWLLSQQIHVKGDWSFLAPELEPGGWTFEYFNDFNPDSDDTAMVIEGLAKSDLSPFPESQEAITKGVNWLTGLQNKDGGFPAWDRGVTPLLAFGIRMMKMPEMSDESAVDITSRSIKALVAASHKFPELEVENSIRKACRFLEKKSTKKRKSPRLWQGEWMTNFLYGTSEAVGALLEADCWTLRMAKPSIDWLLEVQQEDGGWGESPESYAKDHYIAANSTLSQSEWVLTTLILYERLRLLREPSLPSVLPAIEKGIRFLVDRIGDQTQPFESEFTGTFVRETWYARYVSLAHYEGVRVLGAYLSLKQNYP